MLGSSIYIKGRVATKPSPLDARYGNGVGASVLLAVDTGKQVFKNGKWETEESFIFVNIYGQSAEFLLQHGTKGTTIQLEGSVKSRFRDNGKLVVNTVANNVEVLAQPAGYYEWLAQQQAPANNNNFGQAPANNNNFGQAPDGNQGYSQPYGAPAGAPANNGYNGYR